jgi:hypothetical protein
MRKRQRAQEEDFIMRNVRINRTRTAKDEDGKNFLSRRIFIAGRTGAGSVRFTFDGFTSKTTAKTCDNSDNMIVNCAFLLEDTLEKIINEVDVTKLSDPIIIYAPGNFVSTIQGGTYLYWLMKGCMQDGTELSENELALWKSINEFLGKTVGYVALKNIGSAKMKYKDSNGRRIQPSWIQTKDNDLQAKAWARIPGADDADIEEEHDEAEEA